MNLEELEAKKQELIERVERSLYAGEEAKAQQALIIKLLKGTDCTDPDFKEALEDGTAESIISLDMDCYDLTGFVKWLANHDFDLFIDYRYADKVALSDVIQEVETSGEAPACCYDFDIEEFKALSDEIEKGNYIKGISTASYIQKILSLLVGKEAEDLRPFLMSPTFYAWKVASPEKTEQERHNFIMNKSEKMRGVVALCSVALTNAKELEEALINELKTLYKALEINDQDSEKIKDPVLFKIALDLEFNAENLRSCSQDLESVIKDLDRIKI